ncbi:MAG: Holliday junction resolvase RecU [Erysipelotrichaceae bacterium]|nr:Holliday junction resolvase RecU [Erysipelotrichaceae bacterium]MDD4642158.1 Holliday junction resolvase RecU [Erysipelotrichaceae bacterium]
MVNYPTPKFNLGVSNNTKSIRTQHGKRGMCLEDDLNVTNKYYLDTSKAVIHKKPTPIQIVKVDYVTRSTAKITEAYFRKPSTTDYNGVYRQKAIDFEAKETASMNSFPLKSIHKHQLDHLENVIKHGCLAFVIIRFTAYDQTFLVKAKDVIELSKGSKRSIPYKWFLRFAYLIPFGLTPPVDYLKIIDDLYF